MLKKIIIGGIVVIALAAIVIMVVPWGEYESELDKSDLEETVEFSADTTGEESISLDELEGVYLASAGETAEIQSFQFK